MDISLTISTNLTTQHRTRKMYMLSELEPSVELTGGPWYTDNELDTEFIKNLSAAILHYIKDQVCTASTEY
jgi:DNA-directed RNA polymerase III subunit RPC6